MRALSSEIGGRRHLLAHDRRHRRVRLALEAADARAHALEALAEALARRDLETVGHERDDEHREQEQRRHRHQHEGGEEAAAQSLAAPAFLEPAHGSTHAFSTTRVPEAVTRSAVDAGASAEGKGQPGQGHQHVRPAERLLDALQLGPAPIEVANGVGGLESGAHAGRPAGEGGQLLEGEAGLRDLRIPDEEPRLARRGRRRGRRNRLHLQAERGQVRDDALARGLRDVGGRRAGRRARRRGRDRARSERARRWCGQGRQERGREQCVGGLAAGQEVARELRAIHGRRDEGARAPVRERRRGIEQKQEEARRRGQGRRAGRDVGIGGVGASAALRGRHDQADDVEEGPAAHVAPEGGGAQAARRRGRGGDERARSRAASADDGGGGGGERGEGHGGRHTEAKDEPRVVERGEAGQSLAAPAAVAVPAVQHAREMGRGRGLAAQEAAERRARHPRIPRARRRGRWPGASRSVHSRPSAALAQDCTSAGRGRPSSSTPSSVSCTRPARMRSAVPRGVEGSTVVVASASAMRSSPP